MDFQKWETRYFSRDCLTSLVQPFGMALWFYDTPGRLAFMSLALLGEYQPIYERRVLYRTILAGCTFSMLLPSTSCHEFCLSHTPKDRRIAARGVSPYEVFIPNNFEIRSICEEIVETASVTNNFFFYNSDAFFVVRSLCTMSTNWAAAWRRVDHSISLP